MSDTATISVIMPAYNAEKTLEASVDSVLAQTFRQFELLIIDDGSTDATGEIGETFAKKDGRVRVVHQPNRGLAGARNTGLDQAAGDFIVWLDSDDLMESTMIEKLYDAMKDTGADIAMCNYVNVRGDGSVEPRYKIDYGRRVYPMQSMVGFVFGNYVAASVCCNMIPRRLYEGIRFPEGKLFEDVRTSYKIYERAKSMVMLSEPLQKRIVLETGLSSQPKLSNRVDGCLAYIERYEDAVTRWPQYRRAMLVSSAKLLRILRRLVMHNSRADYAACREDIRRICAFYRAHRTEILPEKAGVLLRAEYRLMTQGVRMGFVLSRLVDCIGNRPETYLREIPTPDMPPI